MPKTVAISEKPWSAYKESDYTLEQWDAACLIHQHSGPPTAKSQCKLPVKTPDGTLSRAGVHAAAGALAGARGGVDATSAEKASAAKALVRCYGQLGEDPPASVSMMMHTDLSVVGQFLTHIGTSGQSTEVVSHPSGKGGGGTFDESKVKRDKGGKFSKKAENTELDKQWLDQKNLTDIMTMIAENNWPEIDAALTLMAQKAGYKDLSAWEDAEPKSMHAKAAPTVVGIINSHIAQTPEGVSPSGSKIIEAYSYQNGKEIRARAVSYSGPNPHASETRTLRKDYRFEKRVLDNNNLPSRGHFHFNPDAVLDPSRVHDVSHSDSIVQKFLAHVGVKGMKWGVRKSEGAGVSSSSTRPIVSKAEANAHNAITDHISKSIKSAKTDAEVEGILDQAYQSGHMEDNVKMSSSYVLQNGKKARFELKLYRLTPGKPNDSTADGVKVEYLTKDVKVTKLENKSPSIFSPNGYIAQSNLDNFLKHYGVKGMKWGVRRGDNASGGSKPSKKEAKTAEAVKDTHISADAERFVKTHQKAGTHEMSDREIREALNRAKIVKEYNELFNNPNNSLQQKVALMRLQKDYAQLNAELHPSKIARLNQFLKSASDGYDSFSKLDKATGGELSRTIGEGLGMVVGHRTTGGAHKMGVKTGPRKVSGSNADLKP